MRAIEGCSIRSRPLLRNQADRRFPERVADEEIALGVAEPVVAVADVGGFLFRAGERSGRYVRDL